MKPITYLFACLVAVVSYVEGTGRMTEPLSRGYFRLSDCTNFGIPLSQCPINWSDMNTNCGYSVSTDRSNCGVCGDFDNQDPANPNVKDHEAGGQYARGVAVKTYGKAQTIDVTIEITANNLGSYEFSLCANNDFNTAATESCFTVLADASGVNEFAAQNAGTYTFSLVLPADITCTQCVLRWINKAANNWGTDPETGASGLGFGPQRFFHACADVEIQGCSANCDACSFNDATSATDCTACTAGYFLDGTTCTACPTGCSACADNAGTVECSGCDSGYAMAGTTCEACSTNCDTCSSASVCTACATGIELKEGVCVAHTGETADTDPVQVNLCSCNVCANGGICTTESDGSFSCECPPPFTGNQCLVDTSGS